MGSEGGAEGIERVRREHHASCEPPRARHCTPLGISPGGCAQPRTCSPLRCQTSQEFWNNILGGMPRASELVRSRYSALSDEVKKLSLDLTPFDERFLGLVDEFDQAYSVTLDPATGSRVTTVLDALQRTALVPYVVRSRFYLLAEARDKTRTQPGFKDPGHGDFYVWADYLLGLLTARANGVVFDHAVLVTEDVKIDWSLRGIAHPILVAEVEALAQVPFETWDVDRLAQYVLTVAGPPPEQT